MDRSWMGLRIRALIALGVVAILFPAIGGVLAISRAQSASLRQVEADQRLTVSVVASDVGEAFAFALSSIDALVTRPSLVDAVARRDAPRLRSLLPSMLEAVRPVRTLAVYTGARSQLARHPFPLSSSVPSVTAAAEEQIFAPRPYGKDAILTVRRPIASRGRTVGFLIAEVSFARAVPVVRGLTIGKTGSASVTDREGRVLITGDPRLVGATFRGTPLARALTRPTPSTVRFFASQRNQNLLASAAPVKRYGWAAIVAQPEAEALVPVGRGAMIGGLLGFVVIGFAITLLVTQALDRYERRLSERIVEQQRLNRALEGFSRHVAHDLRTPIAVIQLASQTVEREIDALSDGARRASAMIGRQAVRASDLIEDLLDLARASGTPKLEEIDLEDVVKEAAHDVPALDLRLERPLPKVLADRSALRQAFANLLQNASRYARVDDCATVWVSCSQQNGAWDVAVADSGPGLPEEETQTVFEPFTRGAARANERGSGLGLAIVAAAAQAHGGRAWYEPREGGGSVFRIRIPSTPPQSAPAES